MNAVTRDLKLSSGDIVHVGLNFYSLNLMTKFPGGLKNLQKKMNAMGNAISTDDADGEEVEIPDDVDEAMDAFAYMLWAMIRAGGTVCTKEECSMAIGFDDFDALSEIMDEFGEAAKKLKPKNAPGRAHRR